MVKTIVLALTVSLLFLSGCSGSSSSGGSTTTTIASATTTTLAGSAAAVSIVDLAFNPSTLTIASGRTVTWTNNGAVAHNVISTSGPVSFSSGTINPGGTYAVTFTTVGTYTYNCGIHPSMTGTIIVN